ncbi:hypothetical protein AVEN_97351-1 [Araneus ventricosus]|uniref:Uncharacterized protein n=1 Tax=Araneus ventricosus TaxID=182803 RepID=A0A4Y2NX19_ARAVE|nr:hypothetical protein AVEN_97351-1 [Araneus ventricosus]
MVKIKFLRYSHTAAAVRVHLTENIPRFHSTNFDINQRKGILHRRRPMKSRKPIQQVGEPSRFSELLTFRNSFGKLCCEIQSREMVLAVRNEFQDSYGDLKITGDVC